MRRQEEGFTLIELVIVMVILGILAAVAVPQFYNATTDAENAAASGGKQAVSSAIAIQTARNQGFTTAASVASELSATCSVGLIQLTGTGTRGVKVSVAMAPGSAATACSGANSSALGVISSVYTAL